MMRTTGLLTVIICLMLTLLTLNTVQAQSNLEIIDSSATVEFPDRLSFSLSAESDVNIVDIRLCYSVSRITLAEVTGEVYIEFTPATTVDIDWALEMLKVGGLPPGSIVEYWWQVKDADGNKAKTPRAQVQFADNRYSWRSLTEGNITIHWYEGEESFARELMATAHQVLDKLEADTGAHLENPARLYIYANSNDLMGSMIHPQEWTGGVAYTRFGTIAIGIAPKDLAWGKRAIAHELAHLVVHQMTLNPYSDLPVWLDEGLAMYAEGLPGPEFTSRLYRAVNEDNLISVRSLSSPFSAHTEAAILSYAESYSLVEFLVAKYSQAEMLKLLNTFAQGSGYDEALKKVFGFDMDGLDGLWREYVTRQYQPVAEAKGVHPALVTLFAALAVWLALLLGLATESWAWRQSR